MNFQDYYYEDESINEGFFGKALGRLAKGVGSKAMKIAASKIQQMRNATPELWSSKDIYQIREVEESNWNKLTGDLSRDLLDKKNLKDKGKPHPTKVAKAVYVGNENDFDKIRQLIEKQKGLKDIQSVNDIDTLPKGNDESTVYVLDRTFGGGGKIFLLEFDIENYKQSRAHFVAINKAAERYFKEVEGKPFDIYIHTKKVHIGMDKQYKKEKIMDRVDTSTKTLYGYRIVTEEQIKNWAKMIKEGKQKAVAIGNGKLRGYMWELDEKQKDRVWLLKSTEVEGDYNSIIIIDGADTGKKLDKWGIKFSDPIVSDFQFEWGNSIALKDFPNKMEEKTKGDKKEKPSKERTTTDKSTPDEDDERIEIIDVTDEESEYIEIDKMQKVKSNIPDDHIDWNFVLELMKEGISFDEYLMILESEDEESEGKKEKSISEKIASRYKKEKIFRNGQKVDDELKDKIKTLGFDVETDKKDKDRVKEDSNTIQVIYKFQHRQKKHPKLFFYLYKFSSKKGYHIIFPNETIINNFKRNYKVSLDKGDSALVPKSTKSKKDAEKTKKKPESKKDTKKTKKKTGDTKASLHKDKAFEHDNYDNYINTIINELNKGEK